MMALTKDLSEGISKGVAEIEQDLNDLLRFFATCHKDIGATYSESSPCWYCRIKHDLRLLDHHKTRLQLLKTENIRLSRPADSRVRRAEIKQQDAEMALNAQWQIAEKFRRENTSLRAALMLFANRANWHELVDDDYGSVEDRWKGESDKAPWQIAAEALKSDGE